MLYYLPIEPLEERYTAQWLRWFPAEFSRQRIPFQTVLGESLCDTVEVGTFLDVNSTLHYKAEQLKRVARLFHSRQVKDGDTFFVADVEFWGIESIRYLATLNGIKVKLAGFVHAGSYTTEDFMEPCSSFARHYETGWGQIFDLLFVGSDYHKARLCAKRGIPPQRVIVTGNPYDLDELKQAAGSCAKLKRVIHTNRPDPEKRPELTLALFELLKEKHPDWEMMVTTSRRHWGRGQLRDAALEMQDRGVLVVKEGLSKAEYLRLLGESQVMTGNTIEENFGYCVLEAMALDTIPIVPNAFSHPELLEHDLRCLFRPGDVQSQAARVIRAMERPFGVAGYADKYRHSLSTIVSYCQG